MKKFYLPIILFVFGALMTLAGCSWFNDDKTDYGNYTLETRLVEIDGQKGVEIRKLVVTEKDEFGDEVEVKVTIPETIGGYPVISIGDRAFDAAWSLLSVNMPDTIVNIGDAAFWNASSMTSINIPQSIKYIGDGAFVLCYALEGELVFPSSLVSIGSDAFNSTNISKVSIPSSVEEIGNGAFSDCPSLEYNSYATEKYLGNSQNPYLVLCEIDFSDGEIDFHDDVKIILGEDESGHEIDFERRENSPVSRIEIPDKVTRIKEGAFHSLSNLETVVLGKSVQHIASNAFGCENLKNIYLNDTIESVGAGAFYGTTENVYFDGSIEDYTKIKFLDDWSFDNEYVLYARENGQYVIVEDVTFNDDVSSFALRGCTSVKRVTFEEGVEIIGDIAFAFCVNIEEVNIPDSIIELGENCFAYCKNLKKVTLGSGLTEIPDYCFYECSLLKTISDLTGIERIGMSALSSTGIESIVLPSSVTELGQMAFYDCAELKSIKIEGEMNYIGSSAISDCESLTTLEMKHPSPTVEIHRGFLGDCPSLKYKEYGNGKYVACEGNDYWFLVGYIDGEKKVAIHKDAEHIKEYCFRYASMEVEFEEESRMKEISPFAFSEYYGTQLILPNNVKEIGLSAFSLSSIESLLLPAGLEIIDDHAFAGCVYLEELNIPNSVTFIGSGMFSGRTGMGGVIEPRVKFNEYAGGKYLGNSTNPYFYLYSVTSEDGLVELHPDVKFIGSGVFDTELAQWSFVIPEGVIGVCGYTIESFRGEGTVKLPSTLKYIGNSSFFNIGVRTLVVPDSVEIIERLGVDAYEYIILGTGVKEIRGGFGVSCDVYYEGTKEQFNEIAIIEKDGFYDEFNGTLYYYSETKPTGVGDYWHYADDGVTPIRWNVE